MQLGRAQAEEACEFLAIIDPAIRDHSETGLAVAQRLALEQVFLVHPHQAVTEAYGAVSREFAAVRTAMRQHITHALQVARRNRAAVISQDAENRAHATFASAWAIKSRSASRASLHWSRGVVIAAAARQTTAARQRRNG